MQTSGSTLKKRACGKYSNPLIGIVAMGLEKDEERTKIIHEIPNWYIDIIFSAEGILKTPLNLQTKKIVVLPCRDEHLKFDYLTIANFTNKKKNLRLLVAYIITYLNSVAGETLRNK